MAIEITEIGPEGWDRYAQIAPQFTVRSILTCEPLAGGLGGIAMSEQPVESPYEKYGSDPNDVPPKWAQRFDIRTWGIFLAIDDGQPVGGAAVAPPSPGLVGVEHRTDAAFLFDIRVSAKCRQQGIGKALLSRCAKWAKSKGFKYLVIETQNTNVPASRFYAANGAELIDIRRFGYAHCPAFAQEAMLLWQLTL